jgi:hypothetical protein
VFPSAAKVMRRGSTWQFRQPIAYQKTHDLVHKRVNGMSACDLSRADDALEIREALRLLLTPS